MAASLRFGVIGTGGWSNHSHIPGARSNESVDYVGSIGRHDDLDAFLDTVDAVGFAVPPDVESELALRAIRAGKHVLLDKPIALSVASAEALASAADDARIASLVFVTKRYQPPIADWLESLATPGGWEFGRVEMISPALATMQNPGWRGERGGLWDVGPHAYSLLRPVLGPARSVSARRDERGLVVATLEHDDAMSVMAVSIGAAPGSGGDTALFTGIHGRETVPPLDADNGRADAAYSRAIDALVAQVGRPGHPCDVNFGLEVVRVLDAAERSIASGATVQL